MNITAKELSGMHIGKTITVILDGADLPIERHAGILNSVRHNSETETIRGGGSHILRTSTFQYVDLTIGPLTINTISPDTPITIQEGQ